MMVAIASASIVPAVEQWGVLVTNLGATVVTIIGALYVLIFVLFPPFAPRFRKNRHPTCGTSTKHPEWNTVLMPIQLIATGPCG